MSVLLATSQEAADQADPVSNLWRFKMMIILAHFACLFGKGENIEPNLEQPTGIRGLWFQILKDLRLCKGPGGDVGAH